MKIRGISSSSSMRTYKPKSITPFSFSSSHLNNNHFSILNSITNNTTTTTTTTHHDGDDDDDAIYRFIDPPPSHTEVHDALSSLQRVLGLASRVELLRDTYCNKSENELSNLDQVSEDDPDTDWLEPSLFPYNPKLLQANGSDRVYYAIHLLQTDPSVQKLVKSLSTDEVVWEAVLNNEVVQELKELISSDQWHHLRSLDDNANSGPDNTTNVLIWLLSTACAKFMEAIKKITKIVMNFFQRSFNKTTAHREDYQPFIEKLRAAFMLSIMVLLIVVVRRVQS
ncbi:hypothetical protein QL285_018594 [Trifolium repens]|nr:hypothetical protein QL285_018594 [Trifolium repens]